METCSAGGVRTLSCSRPPHNHTNPGKRCKKQIGDGAQHKDVEGTVVNLKQDKFQAEQAVRERLEELAQVLYEEKEDPAAVLRTEAPYTFVKRNAHYEVRLRLPFAIKGEVGLFMKGDELVVEIGTLRRHIGLPTSMSALSPTKATLQNKILTVEMRET